MGWKPTRAKDWDYCECCTRLIDKDEECFEQTMTCSYGHKHKWKVCKDCEGPLDECTCYEEDGWRTYP